MTEQDKEDEKALEHWGNTRGKLDVLEAKHVDHDPDASVNQLKGDSPALVGTGQHCRLRLWGRSQVGEAPFRGVAEPDPAMGTTLCC